MKTSNPSISAVRLLTMPAPFDVVVFGDTGSASARAHFLRRARKNLSRTNANRACLISSYGWNQIETGAAISLARGWTRNRVRGSRACARRESSTGALERLHDLCSELRTPRRTVAAIYPEIGGAELDDLCRRAADDAVVAVTAKLGGLAPARTTWAYAFVVFEISVKLHQARLAPGSDPHRG